MLDLKNCDALACIALLVLLAAMNGCTVEKSEKGKVTSDDGCEFAVREYGEVGNTYKVKTPQRKVMVNSTTLMIYAEVNEDQWNLTFSLDDPKEDLSLKLFDRISIKHHDGSIYSSIISSPYQANQQDTTFGIYTSPKGMKKIADKGIVEIIIELKNGQTKTVDLSEEQSEILQQDIRCVIQNYTENVSTESDTIE